MKQINDKTVDRVVESEEGRQPRKAAEVSSEELLNGGRELAIRHNGECYQLRLTGNNKLILTK